MTEAEKRVIERARTWIEDIQGEGYDRENMIPYTRPTLIDLLDAASALLAERAAPASPPPAPAVDVAGLEREVVEIEREIAAVLRANPKSPYTQLADLRRRLLAADETLAAARKPKPALLTVDECKQMWIELRCADDKEIVEAFSEAVLSAATERFVAAALHEIATMPAEDLSDQAVEVAGPYLHRPAVEAALRALAVQS